MNQAMLRLCPIFQGGYVSSVGVKLTLEWDVPPEDFLFKLAENTVGKALLPFSAPPVLRDAAGELPYTVRTVQDDKIVWQEYLASRLVSGPLALSYDVVLEKVGKNPAFDLGFEENGMNGSGMTFLPELSAGRWQADVDWDLTKMPSGSSGVWSYGEGHTRQEISEKGLAQTFYAAGDLQSVREGRCGFFWLPDSAFPGREVGTFVLSLYRRMAEFFRDGDAPFNVISRRLPAALTGRNGMGGIALDRSFLFVYNGENPPDTETLKFLFPHEIVHNWITMDDTPFGSCTWYVEGMAEYYSVVLPDRFGMISRRQLLTQMNKRARDYYENPRLTVTNAWAGEHLFHDGEATLVPYGRGFFYLLHMDGVIRKATAGQKCLDDVMFALLDQNRAGQLTTNEDWLRQLSAVTGVDGEREFCEMQNGAVFAPEIGSLVTPPRIVKTQGTTRETGAPCTLYQFE